MEKPIKIAILGASEIAFRRFLPAIKKDSRFEYVGVAYFREQDKDKAFSFKQDFGGEVLLGFDKVFADESIDAVYVPQPPALHYQYGKMVLESGKHLFMEKPFTDALKTTNELVSLARERNLAISENYMFRFHKQIIEFQRLLAEGIIGKIKQFSVRFSFPLRELNDFRYKKSLGGGSILDCGGYTIMLSDILLGGDGKIVEFTPSFIYGFEVDMRGAGIMKSESTGLLCNFSFGMDDDYECSAKAFGEKGILIAPRVITAPADFDVHFQVLDERGICKEDIEIGKDDSFLKSIDNFWQAIQSSENRFENYSRILKQAAYIEKLQKF
jgi:NDP-hexose-3-ketoreductase